VICLAIGAAFATGAAEAQTTARPAGDLMTLPPLRVIDPTYIDTTAKACVDFFKFANGAWLKRDTIPAAYASSGVGRTCPTATSWSCDRCSTMSCSAARS
jgi:putative endopeptidase